MGLKYERSKKEKFINPYNFLEVRNFLSTDRDDIAKETEDKVTGVLECSLFPKTPFCIPGDEVKNEKEKLTNKHKKYDFFKYNDDYVVLGSSLRGVIRSAYEAVTDSCFSTAKIDEVITNRSKSAFKAGVLKRENGRWKLYEAERLCVKKDIISNFHFGQRVTVLERFTSKKTKGKVFVNKLKLYSESDENTQECYLYIGEPFGNPKKGGKKYESIFCVRKGHKDYNVAQKNVEKLKQIYKIYYNNNEKTNVGYIPYKGYEAAEKRGIIPVWYSDDLGGLKLSLACIGRYAYEKNMGEILQDKSPCETSDKVCKACALFGMAGTESIGGRIRITDAQIASGADSYKTEWYTLKPLGSPKNSYLPFYLDEPEDVMNWSYDNTNIRGRKFYWHSDKIVAADEPLSVNSTFKLMYPKQDKLEFRFKVYYDGITKQQLEELIWTLTLGDNRKGSSLCYKIGHGKPLGLGSAKIIINNNKKRDLSCGYELKSEIVPEILNVPKTIDKTAAACLLKAVDRKTTEGKNVTYPYVKPCNGVIPKKNDDASMKWFSENFKLGKKSKPKQTLPEVWKADCEMEAYLFHY